MTHEHPRIQQWRMQQATAARVRELNDHCRTTLRGGRLLLTRGVSALPPDQQVALIRAVRTFDAFNTGNDPHGEHDYGRVEIEGETFLWKIDYYTPDLEHGSENPADPRQTVRVLTVMHSSEY